MTVETEAEEYTAPPAPATWAPLDLTDVLNGTMVLRPPTLMPRTDGHCLLYPGMVHSMQGESESGKSMLAQAEVARTIHAGNLVLYIDHESDQVTVVSRLLKLGATPDDIRHGLDYVRPEAHPMVATADIVAWNALLARPYALAIIDGVTEAFSIFGVKSNDNDEVTTWGRHVPRTIADRTGAAVVVIDHVTKSADGRGRFAIGAQAKMSYLTGASYGIEVLKPLGVGMRGELSIRVGKDRPGLVRPQAGTYRPSDRTQQAAIAIIDSTDGETIQYTLEPPRLTSDDGDFKPTHVMDQVEAYIKDSPNPPSFNSINAGVVGKRATIQEAIAGLIAEGRIRTEHGPNNTTRHHILEPQTTLQTT